jgi:hypothetical protein
MFLAGGVVMTIFLSVLTPLESTGWWNPVVAWRHLNQASWNPFLMMLSPEAMAHLKEARAGLMSAGVSVVGLVAVGGPKAIPALLLKRLGDLQPAGGLGSEYSPQHRSQTRPSAQVVNIAPENGSPEAPQEVRVQYYPGAFARCHPTPSGEWMQPTEYNFERTPLTLMAPCSSQKVVSGRELMHQVAGCCSPITMKRVAHALEASRTFTRRFLRSDLPLEDECRPRQIIF